MGKGIIETQTGIISSKELLDHWQGHRRLSRKVIEAFPQDKLFTHSIGGMRTFADLAQEMIEMAAPGIYGILTGKWIQFNEMKEFADIPKPKTKENLLSLWDKITAYIDELWSKIPDKRFQESDNAFGQYEGTIISFLFYFIDNEIHHRGQGYVYLRSLGITPPLFWDRG